MRISVVLPLDQNNMQIFTFFLHLKCLKCWSSHCSLSVTCEWDVELCRALLHAGAALLLDLFLQELLAFDPDCAAGPSNNYLRNPKMRFHSFQKRTVSFIQILRILSMNITNRIRTKSQPGQSPNLCLSLCRRGGHSGYTRTKLLTL